MALNTSTDSRAPHNFNHSESFVEVPAVKQKCQAILYL